MKRSKYDSIDAYLKGTGRTQQQLAEDLGVTQGALSMIANGKRVPRPELALRIHSMTGVPLATLLTRRDGTVPEDEPELRESERSADIDRRDGTDRRSGDDRRETV